MQETRQIRWLMYCKSAIRKSGQFEFDSVIMSRICQVKQNEQVDSKKKEVI